MIGTQTLSIVTETVVRDPRAINDAEQASQRIRLAQPLRFGVDPAMDFGAFRFLSMATERYAVLDWELAGALPWPLRAVVHLCPPSGADHEGWATARDWRRQFALALCTYRIGPGFVLIRDNRPGGAPVRAELGERWVAPFRALITEGEGSDKDARALLGELVPAGLALRLDDGRHVMLPTRLRRWPVPYFAA